MSGILHQNRDLYDALHNPPFQKTEVRYIQWIGETKEKVEHVLHKDTQVPRLLHACLRHLEVHVYYIYRIKHETSIHSIERMR